MKPIQRNKRLDLLKRKNQGTRLMPQYLNELNMLNIKNPNILSLEDTDQIRSTIAQRMNNISEKFYGCTEEDIHALLDTIGIDQEVLYFSPYAEYCGAAKIKIGDIIHQIPNFKHVKDGILSLVSDDYLQSAIIDYDNGELEIEIVGKEWIDAMKQI